MRHRIVLINVYFCSFRIALKVRWLHRLSELVAKAALPDWQQAADKTGLHPEFADWISDAMSHLDHHCAQVGPQPPDQKEYPSDPTAEDLATLISADAEAMVANTLSLACEVWWQRLDEAVFAPLKQQMKDLKEEQKQCEESLEQEPPPKPAEIRELT